MTWSTNNNPTNPFSARSMTSQYLTNPALKARRDRINRQCRNCGSTSSSDSFSSSSSYSSDSFSSSSSYSLTYKELEGSITERDEQLRQHLNESICTKLFSACCGKK